LTWHLAGKAPALPDPGTQTQVDTAAPPRAILAELLDLTRMGKLVRVEQIALDLEQRDARYGPFARHLYSLARGFEEERLVSILENCIEATRDGVTG